ncbi:MAG: rhomboid family intramembrane serine protease [Muribaculaceae bacterium]|nr:rhomboid family intramembrane serine protease [Muribaculaceae bacterium]
MATTSIIKYILPRPTPALALLITVNVLISLLIWSMDGMAGGGGHLATSISRLLTLPPAWKYVAECPWTLLTYMFTQISPAHLLFNMLWLYWFGTYLQHIMSGIQIAGVYLCGGIAGGVLYILAHNSLYYAVPDLTGASAAVIAVITVVSCRMYRTSIRMPYVGNISILWFTLPALLLSFAESNSGEGLALPAHLGGLLAGLVIGCHHMVNRERIHTILHRLRIRRRSRRAREIFTGSLGDRSISASSGRAENRARLDTLLDKIHTSGYDSLSPREREELEHLSHNI